MSQKWVFILALLTIVTLMPIRPSLGAKSGDSANIYPLSKVGDIETMMNADAEYFGMDKERASIDEVHLGRRVMKADDCEVRRNLRNGNMYYIKHSDDWPRYPKNEEPFFEEEIMQRAMEIVEHFGISEEEINTKQVSRIVSQGEDQEGNFTGPRETQAFLVMFTRKLNGLKVSNSQVKVFFNSEGELRKVILIWRGVEKSTSVCDLQEESILESEAFAKMHEDETLIDPVRYFGEFIYVEEPDPSEQSTLEPKFILTYQKVLGEMPIRVVVDACK